MAVKQFNTRVKLKYDGHDNWKPATGTGLVLLQGEFAFDSNKKNFFIGDGTTSSKALPYIIGAAIMADYQTPEWYDGSEGHGAAADVTGVLSASDSLNIALAKLQKQVSAAVAGGVTDVKIDNTTIVSNNVADIATTGNYDASTNKIATASYVDGKINALDTSDTVQPITITDPTSSVGAIITLKGIDEANGIISQGTGTASLQLARVATSGDASDVNITDSGNYYTATTVEGALAEVATTIGSMDLAAVALASQADGTGTSTITIKGISEADGVISLDSTTNKFDIVTEGVYDSSTNRIATESTVTNAVNEALDSEVTFMGVTASLPSTGVKNGDMWKASDAISVTAQQSGEGSAFTTKAGDTIIYKNVTGATDNGWYLIPSGDSDTDTWRAIQLNGTEILGSGISTGAVNFASSAKIDITNASGTVTFTHNAVDTTSATYALKKIYVDSTGHVATNNDAIVSTDIKIVSGDPGYGTGNETVSTALQALNTSITNAGITIDGHKGAITTGNGLTDVDSDGGSFSVKIDSTNARGLSVGANGIAMDYATGASFGTVKVTTGNGLSLTDGVVSYTHNTTAITVASKDFSTNVVTINGTLTPDAGDNITTSNAIALAAVAVTASASDVNITDTDNHYTATTVEGALDEIAEWDLILNCGTATTVTHTASA